MFCGESGYIQSVIQYIGQVLSVFLNEDGSQWSTSLCLDFTNTKGWARLVVLWSFCGIRAHVLYMQNHSHTYHQPTHTHTQSRGISAEEAWWVTRYVGPEPVALYSEASCPPTYTLDSQACLQVIIVSQTHTVAQVHLWDSSHNSK